MTPRLAFGLTSIAVAVATIALVSEHTHAQSAPRSFHVRDAAGEIGGGVIDEIEAPGDHMESSQFRVSSAPRLGTLAANSIFTFFPQAGTQTQDLFLLNYVDLNHAAYDIAGPGLDFECTDKSYAGHNGHDSMIAGFREQAIGVPIFAAAAGTVVAVHDGEFDQQTVNVVDRVANYVAIQHAGGVQTQYLHLKNGSVSVRLGQNVAAGTQLGLTGSSGNSSWPHLHLSTYLNGAVTEPSAGKCRPGDSYWSAQPPFRRDTFVGNFTYGVEPFLGNAQYPFDEAVRTGTYVQGTGALYFRFTLRSLPAQSRYRIVVSRPDGTTALDSAGDLGNASFFKHAWYWFFRSVALNASGTWSLDLFINDQLLATAPFTVVESRTAIVNHPPLPLRSVSIEPASPDASNVTICRVTPGNLYRRDPDYDLVRYRYRWFVREALVRDVTTAALSDVIPAGTLRAGDSVRCEVTPLDDTLAGATATATPGGNSQQLAAGGSLLSIDGAFKLLYQDDGNLVLYDTRSNVPVWMTNTGGTLPGRLVMQGDGNLVLLDANGVPVWNTGTGGNSGAYFVLQSDGNFVVYAATGEPIWDRYR